MKNIKLSIYYLCSFLCIYIHAYSQDITHPLLLEDKSIEIKNGKYYKKNQLITEKMLFYYKSGRLKAEINLVNGMLNGLSIGYLDNDRTDNYKKIYVYNYENNRKIGSQVEYYEDYIQLPNYKKVDERSGMMKFTSWLDREKLSFFGNRDNFNPIEFIPNKYCSYTYRKNNPDSSYLCQSGSLSVYYEKMDKELKKILTFPYLDNSISHKFFETSYGPMRGYWYLSRKTNGIWHWD